MDFGPSASYFKSLFWALTGVLILFCWDFALIKSNYGGDFSALFRTGDRFPIPSDLKGKTYIFYNSPGYDGQYYRYVALDPFWIKRNIESFDSVPRRYPRILIPLISYLLATGKPNLIDYTYFIAVGLLVFLGGFYLSQYAVHHGRTPTWGIVFAFLPASVISATMMTVDVGVLALSIAFCHFMDRRRYSLAYLVVMLAPLCSEAGFLLVAGASLWLIINKERRMVFLMGTAALPALGWNLYVQTFIRAQTGGTALPPWLMEQPLTGIFHAAASTLDYRAGPYLEPLIRLFDRLSLGAILMAFALIGTSLIRRPANPIALTGSLFIALAIILNNQGFWAVPIGYLRPFSALFGFLMMLYLSGEPKRIEAWLAWLAIAIVSLRVIGQFIYTEFIAKAS